MQNKLFPRTTDCTIDRVTEWQREYLYACRCGFGMLAASCGLLNARFDWVTMGVL